MEAGWERGELLALDFETTGVDRREDVPVSFALVVARGGRIIDQRAALIDPGREIPAEATAIHGITTARARSEGMPLVDALATVAAAVIDAGERCVPVVGMNLSFDLTILHHQMRKHLGTGLLERGWCGPVLDVLVLDRHLDRYRPGKRRLEHLCAHYSVTTEQSHDAAADAIAAMRVLLALCRCYPRLVGLGLVELTELQSTWHRQWATSYDDWRARNGQARLEPSEFDWPLAGAPALLAGLSG